MNLLLWYWGRRGLPPLTYELANGLRQIKDVRVFLSLSRQSDLFAETQSLGVTALHVDTYTGPISALLSFVRIPFSLLTLYRFARGEKIDVAICMMRHLWGPGAFFALRRAGVRVLLILHDARQHPGEDYPFSNLHLKADLVMTDGVIALSQHVAEITARDLHYPPERIWRSDLPSINFGKVRAGPRDWPTGRPIRLLFLGRLLPYKGLDTLAESFGEISKRHAVTLSVIGSGPPDTIKNLVGLPNVAIQNRWVREHEIGEFLEEADILVAPYHEASQSGIVPAAFAAALPVVATPVGGLAEQVQEGVNGVLAAGLQPADFTVALDRLLNDRALYRACSAGALATSRGRLSTDAFAKELCAAARTLCTLPPRV